MKKITFILFALIAGTSFAQNTANANATVFADIVNPITISIDGILNFGVIAADDEIATIVLSPENIRTISDGMIVPGNTTTSVPTFTITKEESVTYNITTDITNLNLEGQSEITITDLTNSLSNEWSGLSADSFTIGGSINLAANQGAGTYEGLVKVTVSYE